MKPKMTRAMFYCPWCRNNPTRPCDAHAQGYARMLALMPREGTGIVARVRRWLAL